MGLILSKKHPIVINTWNFQAAGEKGTFFDCFRKNNIKPEFNSISMNLAWEVIQNPDRTAIDAIVEGCSVCERDQCDGTVGYGGSPDENADVALDALLIDGYSPQN